MMHKIIRDTFRNFAVAILICVAIVVVLSIEFVVVDFFMHYATWVTGTLAGIVLLLIPSAAVAWARKAA